MDRIRISFRSYYTIPKNGDADEFFFISYGYDNCTPQKMHNDKKKHRFSLFFLLFCNCLLLLLYITSICHCLTTVYHKNFVYGVCVCAKDQQTNWTFSTREKRRGWTEKWHPDNRTQFLYFIVDGFKLVLYR